MFPIDFEINRIQVTVTVTVTKQLGVGGGGACPDLQTDTCCFSHITATAQIFMQVLRLNSIMLGLETVLP